MLPSKSFATISRYSIIFGKILGETLVVLPQVAAILLFAFVIGVPPSWTQIGGLAVAGFISLEILSLLSPLRYAVDLTRVFFYTGQPKNNLFVLASPWLNLTVIANTTRLPAVLTANMFSIGQGFDIK